MQAAEEQSRSQSQGDGSGPGFLSPGKAFALLIGVILLIGIIIFVTRPDPPGGTTTHPDNAAPPTFELTDAEALARFEELDAMRLEMYEARDDSLLSTFLTTDSPLRPLAAEEIRQLKRDRVRVIADFETQDLEVISNTDDEIRVRQVVLEEPTFLRRGREVNETPPRLTTIVWTLRMEDSVWKIFNSETIRSRKL